MNAIGQLGNKVHLVKTLVDVGMVRPTRPDRLLRTGLALVQWGPTPAAGYTASAIRTPDAAAIIDELGTLSFRDVHERTNALAHQWSAHGIGEGDAVAILARNHRGFIDAVVACSKLGCHALFLNTMFAGPQITDVCEREQPAAVVYDEEFTELVHDALQGRKGFVAWTDGDTEHTDPVLEDLIARGDTGNVSPPKEKGRVVILTSGTTGTPKGANRKQPESLEPAAALLRKIPLQAVAEHRCTALCVVPVMLQRTMEVDEAILARYDVSSLRVIAASGSALPGELATRVMDRFGDVLYNLYGSTEVAWATIAQPRDMRQASGTAGRPPRGTVVRLYDEQGREAAPGQTGRIFVGNEMMFDGYTGGGNKELIGALMSTGDVGHFDAAGRLFVDGRDDEMIVSGGENVFPREVEDLLADHEAIKEAAVLGVDDEQFGQRLSAFVVLRDGHELSDEDLRAHVKARLAAYKVPRDIAFMDELPRNATGKVLKRELKERSEPATGTG